MRTSDFDYELPPELIAQEPLEPRDSARLLVLSRATSEVVHRGFRDLPGYLRLGDVLVCNDSRVIPARLRGRKVATGGAMELLLLREEEPGLWRALVKPARRVKAGALLELGAPPLSAQAEVVAAHEDGTRLVRFADPRVPEALGAVPLPPYIKHPLADGERYQSVYATAKGSAAAPTAGLHFTRDLMGELEGMGVRFAFVTLHIGLDTFRPVREDDPRQHRIHCEHCRLGQEEAALLNQAKQEGRRIVAVGTTSVRVLETAAREAQRAASTDLVVLFEGSTDLYILPGHRFLAVDALLTNFHLPCSTLLMLVCAFAGREAVLAAYREAIRLRYRFYSFGDAMLML